MDLDQKGSIMAEYIWIDVVGGLRSKSRVRVSPPPRPIACIPFPQASMQSTADDELARLHLWSCVSISSLVAHCCMQQHHAFLVDRGLSLDSGDKNAPPSHNFGLQRLNQGGNQPAQPQFLIATSLFESLTVHFVIHR